MRLLTTCCGETGYHKKSLFNEKLNRLLQKLKIIFLMPILILFLFFLPLVRLPEH